MTTAMALLLAGVLVCEAGPATAPPEQAKSAHTPRGKAPAMQSGEWEIVFADEITVEEYARQLDYFKIEVAAVSKNGKIESISRLSKRKPERRVGTKATDYRLHIGWKQGTLHAADRKLLAKAGINSQGKELWHFFPVETQELLAALERVYALRDAGEIERTRFEIRPKTKGEGYEFVVVEQDPPKRIESSGASAASRNKRSTD